MARNATYYDGDLRRDLLDAALAQIRTGGPASVSLRQLARAVGVSHAAPANHFKDKRALFTAIAVEGFELLSAAFADAARRAGADADPVEVLRQGGRAYVRFALEHRAHFEVMWRRDLLADDDPALAAAGAATLEFLTGGVATAQATGWWPAADSPTLAVTLWSVVHGLATLWIQGPLPQQFEEGPEVLSGRVVDLLTRWD